MDLRLMRQWIDLCESGNAISYEWVEQSARTHEAKFLINGVGYWVKAYESKGTLPTHEHPESIWVLGFGIDDQTATRLHGYAASKMHPTNLGHPFKVIATVQAIFDDFIDHNRPEIVYFSALTEGARGRIPLYKRFAAHIVNKFHYSYDDAVIRHFADLEHPAWVLRA